MKEYVVLKKASSPNYKKKKIEMKYKKSTHNRSSRPSTISRVKHELDAIQSKEIKKNMDYMHATFETWKARIENHYGNSDEGNYWNRWLLNTPPTSARIPDNIRNDKIDQINPGSGWDNNKKILNWNGNFSYEDKTSITDSKTNTNSPSRDDTRRSTKASRQELYEESIDRNDKNEIAKTSNTAQNPTNIMHFVQELDNDPPLQWSEYYVYANDKDSEVPLSISKGVERQCQECETAVAEKLCYRCEQIFCRSCCSEVHRKDPFSRHITATLRFASEDKDGTTPATNNTASKSDRNKEEMKFQRQLRSNIPINPLQPSCNLDGHTLENNLVGQDAKGYLLQHYQYLSLNSMIDPNPEKKNLDEVVRHRRSSLMEIKKWKLYEHNMKMKVSRKLRKLQGKEPNIYHMFKRLSRYGHARKLPPEVFERACKKLKIYFVNYCEMDWLTAKLLTLEKSRNHEEGDSFFNRISAPTFIQFIKTGIQYYTENSLMKKNRFGDDSDNESDSNHLVDDYMQDKALTPRTIYLYTCLQRKLAPEASIISSHSDSILNLSNKGFGNERFFGIIKSIPLLTNLTVLDVSGNRLNDKTCFSLIKAIRELAKLNSLILSNNSLGRNSLREIGAFLASEKCNLVDLALKNCNITNEGAKFLIRGLRRHISKLGRGRDLDLNSDGSESSSSETDIDTSEDEDIPDTDDETEDFYQSLKEKSRRQHDRDESSDMHQRQQALFSLDMSKNKLGTNAFRMFGIMLRYNKALQNLNMSWNEIGRTVVSLMMPSTTTSGGILVGETSTMQSNAWIKIFVKGVAISNLKTLNLSWNALDDTDIEEIAKVIISNEGQSNTSSIEYLCLSHNKITKIGAQYLSEALLKNRSLLELTLDSNPLQREGVYNIKSAASIRLARTEMFLQLSLIDCDVSKNASQFYTFDKSRPQGNYILDLSQKTERNLLCKLQHIIEGLGVAAWTDIRMNGKSFQPPEKWKPGKEGIFECKVISIHSRRNVVNDEKGDPIDNVGVDSSNVTYAAVVVAAGNFNKILAKFVNDISRTEQTSTANTNSSGRTNSDLIMSKLVSRLHYGTLNAQQVLLLVQQCCVANTDLIQRVLKFGISRLISVDNMSILRNVCFNINVIDNKTINNMNKETPFLTSIDNVRIEMVNFLNKKLGLDQFNYHAVNPTNHYKLNLSRPLERMLAFRLYQLGIHEYKLYHIYSSTTSTYGDNNGVVGSSETSSTWKLHQQLKDHFITSVWRNVYFNNKQYHFPSNHYQLSPGSAVEISPASVSNTSSSTSTISVEDNETAQYIWIPPCYGTLELDYTSILQPPKRNAKLVYSLDWKIFKSKLIDVLEDDNYSIGDEESNSRSRTSSKTAVQSFLTSSRRIQKNDTKRTRNKLHVKKKRGIKNKNTIPPSIKCDNPKQEIRLGISQIHNHYYLLPCYPSCPLYHSGSVSANNGGTKNNHYKLTKSPKRGGSSNGDSMSDDPYETISPLIVSKNTEGGKDNVYSSKQMKLQKQFVKMLRGYVIHNAQCNYTCNHLKSILLDLPANSERDVYYVRVEVIVTLFSKLIDKENLYFIFEQVQLTETEEYAVYCRLGPLNLFDSMSYYRKYHINFTRYDECNLFKILYQLSIKDAKNLSNWKDIRFNSYPFKIPSTWFENSSIYSFPNHGMISFQIEEFPDAVMTAARRHRTATSFTDTNMNTNTTTSSGYSSVGSVKVHDWEYRRYMKEQYCLYIDGSSEINKIMNSNPDKGSSGKTGNLDGLLQDYILIPTVKEDQLLSANNKI